MPSVLLCGFRFYFRTYSLFSTIVTRHCEKPLKFQQTEPKIMFYSTVLPIFHDLRHSRARRRTLWRKIVHPTPMEDMLHWIKSVSARKTKGNDHDTTYVRCSCNIYNLYVFKKTTLLVLVWLKTCTKSYGSF